MRCAPLPQPRLPPQLRAFLTSCLRIWTPLLRHMASARMSPRRRNAFHASSSGAHTREVFLQILVNRLVQAAAGRHSQRRRPAPHRRSATERGRRFRRRPLFFWIGRFASPNGKRRTQPARRPLEAQATRIFSRYPAPGNAGEPGRQLAHPLRDMGLQAASRYFGVLWTCRRAPGERSEQFSVRERIL